MTYAWPVTVAGGILGREPLLFLPAQEEGALRGLGGWAAQPVRDAKTRAPRAPDRPSREACAAGVTSPGDCTRRNTHHLLLEINWLVGAAVRAGQPTRQDTLASNNLATQPQPRIT